MANKIYKIKYRGQEFLTIQDDQLTNTQIATAVLGAQVEIKELGTLAALNGKTLEIFNDFK